MASARARGQRRPRGVWSPEIRDRFLALLRETGNARAAIRVLGHGNMFYKRRRRDPEFARAWAEAVAAAHARLAGAESRFPASGMGTPACAGAGASNCPPASNCPRDAAALLRPGRKRRPKERGHVIRRTRGGRAQIALARECEMDAAGEADFLARLRATGNFSGSARAIGFQPASLFDRYRKWPAFARACDEAIEAASVQLDFALVAYAHRLLGTVETAGEEGMGTVASNCPQEAMRILSFIDRRRGSRTTRGPRKGPPERSFAQAVESVLAKIEAIERHEKMMSTRASPPLDGEG